jgi:hypothetical protein
MGKRWKGLKREVEELRQQLLPDPFDPTGNYPQPALVQLKTRAFLILSHGAIETFLEEWARDLARACEEVWKTSARVTPPMAFMLGVLIDRLPLAVIKPGAKDCHGRFADAVTRMFPEYYKRINDNNGVKETNFLQLFDALGVPAAALSPTLLPNLTELGKARGDQAHHSMKSVPNIVDPETEYLRVSIVLVDLEAFEQWLIAYRRKIR